jgi:hypothetical protein
VAGTFNDWNTTATPLKKSGDGEWKAELQLLPGRYEYKLLVDGAASQAVMTTRRAGLAMIASPTRLAR